ncbi:unnamed protein product, partial [marine sediment metagenome]
FIPFVVILFLDSEILDTSKKGLKSGPLYEITNPTLGKIDKDKAVYLFMNLKII